MIQKITLSKGNILTKSNLRQILDSARSTYQYARFDLHKGIYITIQYNRDNTIEVFTNSRDINLWQQIKFLRGGYSQTKIIDFIFRWINQINK